MLEETIVLVAGATRGAGRGIATALGRAGATVWCTGRSVAGHTPAGRPETIEETAALVTEAGGTGRWVRTDHTDPEAVRALIEQIRAEHGRLDVLVNDIWGGDALTHWGPLWEHDLADGMRMLELGLHTHLITAHAALPLLLQGGASLLIEVTDGVGAHYRGSLFYDLVKAATRRLGLALHAELAPLGHAAVAVTPGFLRSEAMLDHFGVTEATWRDAIAADPHFAASETPSFLGAGIAALVADPQRATLGGRVLSSGWLAERYDLTDLDGTRPHFGRHAVGVLVEALEALQPSALQQALRSPGALAEAVGTYAAPFVTVGGEALLERLRSGQPALEAAQATVQLG